MSVAFQVHSRQKRANIVSDKNANINCGGVITASNQPINTQPANPGSI